MRDAAARARRALPNSRRRDRTPGSGSNPRAAAMGWRRARPHPAATRIRRSCRSNASRRSRRSRRRALLESPRRWQRRPPIAVVATRSAGSSRRAPAGWRARTIDPASWRQPRTTAVRRDAVAPDTASHAAPAVPSAHAANAARVPVDGAVIDSPPSACASRIANSAK